MDIPGDESKPEFICLQTIEVHTRAQVFRDRPFKLVVCNIPTVIGMIILF